MQENQSQTQETVTVATPHTRPAEDVRSSAWLGADLIKAERVRQISGEWWAAEHDDQHEYGELALAAACYAMAHLDGAQVKTVVETFWPWEAGWWKPSADPVRNLEKAGALIAAEIDRIKRRKTKAPNEKLCERGDKTP